MGIVPTIIVKNKEGIGITINQCDIEEYQKRGWKVVPQEIKDKKEIIETADQPDAKEKAGDEIVENKQPEISEDDIILPAE